MLPASLITFAHSGVFFLMTSVNSTGVFRYPFINVGLVRKTTDVSDFRPGTVRLNLPITLGNSLWDKDDTGRFAQCCRQYGPELNRFQAEEACAAAVRRRGGGYVH